MKSMHTMLYSHLRPFRRALMLHLPHIQHQTYTTTATWLKILRSGSTARTILSRKTLTIFRISIRSLRLRGPPSTILNYVGCIHGPCFVGACERCKHTMHTMGMITTKAYLFSYPYLFPLPGWWHCCPAVERNPSSSQHRLVRTVHRRWPC